MLRSYRALLAGVLFAALTLGETLSLRASEPSARGDAYRVIVNADNPVGSLDKRTLANIFLKKITQWPDGQVIYPADLEASQEVRKRFSHDVVGRSVDAVKSYWQQAIFSGRDVPPVEFANSAEIIKYILAHKGAIAYISASEPADNVKTITVR